MALYGSAGSKIINPEIGDTLCGQLFIRKAEYIRDNLEVNALYLSDEKEDILIFSLDVIGLEYSFCQKVINEISKKLKIKKEGILLSTTHTHAGPTTVYLQPDEPVNEKYLQKLSKILVSLAQELKEKAEAVKIGYGKGTAHIGYNRRTCWFDGTHMMYGNSPGKKGFSGIEGPEDPQHTVLTVINKKNEVVAVLHNNSCHSTCLEALNFVSADYPGEARKLIREAIGNIPVLYLQGASGDLAPVDMLNPSKNNFDIKNRERRMKEIGYLLAGETLRIIHNIDFEDRLNFKVNMEVMTMEVRLPTKEEIKKAKDIVKKGEKKAGRWNYVLSHSILKLYDEFKDRPFDKIQINTISANDFAIATNPFEFYCQFGLDIKNRSPFKNTIISQLTNGWKGYCPTIYGYLGGGYSGMTIYWTRFEPFAGYKVVDKSSIMLWKMKEER